MAFQKLLRSALFAVVVVSLTSTALASDESAETLNTELALYSFSSDPFLLDWTFRVEHVDKSLENELSTQYPANKEDAKLEKWKAKQAEKWENLPKEKFIINASAYTAAADECGKSNGITSSGLKVEENRTLACPPEYPFGAKIAIEGMGVYRCEDRGGAIKGNHFDIYMETKQQAFAFGRRNLEAEVVD